MDKKKNVIEEQYPYIKPAYEIALKSYDWCINRSNAIDGGIDKLLGWISSVTLALIAFISTHYTVNFSSKWFYCSMILFVGAIISGLATKAVGSLKLLHPKILHEEFYSLDEFQFKTDILIRAGEAFTNNQFLVNWKGWVSILMIICFIAEMFFLLKWFISF